MPYIMPMITLTMMMPFIFSLNLSGLPFRKIPRMTSQTIPIVPTTVFAIPIIVFIVSFSSESTLLLNSVSGFAAKQSSLKAKKKQNASLLFALTRKFFICCPLKNFLASLYKTKRKVKGGFVWIKCFQNAIY